MKLVRFDQDSFDNTLMWTLSGDLGNDGFGFIRMMNDISLKLAAFQGDKGVGATIRLSDSADGGYSHQWKILPWSVEPYVLGGHAVCLYCKADEGSSAIVRSGTVCLALPTPTTSTSTGSRTRGTGTVSRTRMATQLSPSSTGPPAMPSRNPKPGNAL